MQALLKFSIAVILSCLLGGFRSIPVWAQPKDAFTSAPTLLQQGRQLLDLRQYEQALRYFSRYSEIRGEEPEGYFWQGIALDEMGRYEEAANAYEQAIHKALERGMDSAEIRVDLANVLLKAHRLDEAIAQYKKAIDIDGRLVLAHLNLARAYIERGDWQLALDNLDRSSELGFRGAHLPYYRAKALSGLGRKGESARQVEVLMQQLPDDAKKSLIRNEFRDGVPPVNPGKI